MSVAIEAYGDVLPRPGDVRNLLLGVYGYHYCHVAVSAACIPGSFRVQRSRSPAMSVRSSSRVHFDARGSPWLPNDGLRTAPEFHRPPFDIYVGDRQVLIWRYAKAAVAPSETDNVADLI